MEDITVTPLLVTRLILSGIQMLLHGIVIGNYKIIKGPLYWPFLAVYNIYIYINEVLLIFVGEPSVAAEKMIIYNYNSALKVYHILYNVVSSQSCWFVLTKCRWIHEIRNSCHHVLVFLQVSEITRDNPGFIKWPTCKMLASLMCLCNYDLTWVRIHLSCLILLI